ncbi:MAG: folate-binding protein, partial [Gammaproteobacteria bacterium]|nr:folate-binding protein [Gammaproteobacteria bacterium]
KVVDAQPAKEGGFELLVVTEITLFEQDNLHLNDPNGPKLAFRKLPYSLNEA